MQIRAEDDAGIPATEHVDQFAYRAHAMDKGELLAKVLQARGRGLTMIFTRTKRTAQKVADDLTDRGFAAAAVHGDLGQGAREQALRAFRSGKVDVLVATDVAARGLDVDDVTHVINYQCPEDAMTYVHRIGRTARAGKSGTAITLIDWDDLPKWKLICDTLNLPFHEPAETYSTSPHLFLELDIPADAKSVLPRAARTRAGLDAEQLEDLGGSDRKRPGPRRGPAVRRRSVAARLRFARAGAGRGRGRLGAGPATAGPASDRTGSPKPFGTGNVGAPGAGGAAHPAGPRPAEQSATAGTPSRETRRGLSQDGRLPDAAYPEHPALVALPPARRPGHRIYRRGAGAARGAGLHRGEAGLRARRAEQGVVHAPRRPPSPVPAGLPAPSAQAGLAHRRHRRRRHPV